MHTFTGLVLDSSDFDGNGRMTDEAFLARGTSEVVLLNGKVVKDRDYIFSANVPHHLPRTDGAADAREAGSAGDMTEVQQGR